MQIIVSPLVRENRQLIEPEVRLALHPLRNEVKETDEEEDFILLRPPVKISRPDETSQAEPVLSEEFLLREKPELIPPRQNERIILKQPGSK